MERFSTTIFASNSAVSSVRRGYRAGGACVLHVASRAGHRTLAAGLALVLLVLLAGGCAGRSAPPVDRSRDATIMQEVQARLAAETSLDGTQIRVEVDGGRVTLFGGVKGVAAWQCAIHNAQLVTGVRSVVDYLVIERGPARVVCAAPRSRN